MKALSCTQLTDGLALKCHKPRLKSRGVPAEVHTWDNINTYIAAETKLLTLVIQGDFHPEHMKYSDTSANEDNSFWNHIR
jgi:hypothetical protein